MQQPGLAGLGSGLPHHPLLLAPRQLKLCVTDREQQAREKDRVGAMGAATPQGDLHDPLGTGCRQDSLGLH